MNNAKQLHVYLSEEEYAKIKDAAKKANMTVSKWIRNVVKQYELELLAAEKIMRECKPYLDTFKKSMQESERAFKAYELKEEK